MYREFIRPFKKKVKDDKTGKLEEREWYRCIYCSKEYDKEDTAKKCLDSHELVLLPISRTDLNRLNQFLYLREEKLLTESLVKIIQKYVKNLARLA